MSVSHGHRSSVEIFFNLSCLHAEQPKVAGFLSVWRQNKSAAGGQQQALHVKFLHSPCDHQMLRNPLALGQTQP